MPVSSRRITLPDGNTVTAHGINIGEAEVPERTYEGDIAGAIYEKDLVKLMFAQSKLGGGMRSLVIISMTPVAVEQFVTMVGQLEKPSLQEIANSVQISPESLTDFPSTEPEQTAALRANFIAAAFSGQDACLDFYHANPFATALIPSTGRLHLEAIVRVNTYTSLVLSLISRLRDFSKSFPPSAKQLVGKSDG